MKTQNFTDTMREYYADGRPHSNQALYDFFDQLYGTQDRDSRNHVLRALQQELKKNGELVNVGFGVWKLA